MYVELYILPLSFIGGHFNFPKLHSLQHYLDSIRLLGTTDNCNTEATERLHIDLAKDAYRATNKKDYYEQMLLWLERREKIWAFEVVLQWRQGIMPRPHSRYVRRHSLGPHLAMTPSAPNTSVSTIKRNHGAISFVPALRAFISQYKDQLSIAPGSRQSNNFAITHVDIWYLLKFYVRQLHASTVATPETAHIAYATPERKGSEGKTIPARFDTVLVNEGDSADGNGITGAQIHILTLFIAKISYLNGAGKRVGQIRVIFKIPERFISQMFDSHVKPPGALAYVEWFTRPRHKAPSHKMYRVSRSIRSDGSRDASVIEVDTIIRSCQLFPKFSGRVNRAWTSDNVLERCEHFFVNNWLDHHTYQTTW